MRPIPRHLALALRPKWPKKFDWNEKSTWNSARHAMDHVHTNMLNFTCSSLQKGGSNNKQGNHDTSKSHNHPEFSITCCVENPTWIRRSQNNIQIIQTRSHTSVHYTTLHLEARDRTKLIFNRPWYDGLQMSFKDPHNVIITHAPWCHSVKWPMYTPSDRSPWLP